MERILHTSGHIPDNRTPLQSLTLRIAKQITFATLLAGTTTVALQAEKLPSALAGSWRISRILPTSNQGCWDQSHAKPLIGNVITYRSAAMSWKGEEIPVNGIVTRTLSEKAFRAENPGPSGAATFAQLGVHAGALLEVDLQHEDMDITGASTEVPGDSVLLAAPNRIIISACGVYMEATKVAGKPQARR